MENKTKKEIILATANPHKLEEITAISGYSDVCFSLVEGDFNPEETGTTFEENAYIKAFAAAKIMKKPALADDSGLCVDALDGAPGLYSARYADTPQERINKLINELKNVSPEKRTAHFISAMVLVDKDGNILHKTVGTVEGIIIDEVRGTNGFGYDPVFYMPKYNQTMAELPSEIKNSISHRANALKTMLKWISANYK